MFPLESALLPGDELPLRIFEPRYSALVRDCLAADQNFGVVLIERGREVGGDDVRSDVGVMVHIAEYEDYGAGRYRLRCPVRERIRVIEWLPDDPYPRAVVETWPDEPGTIGDAEIGDLENRIWALFERIASARGMEIGARELLFDPAVADDPGRQLYALAARLPIGAADRYAVLSAPSPSQRLVAMREAVETVAALVEFQLSSPGDEPESGD
ncbi:LON peptidase substrate-binding domain-containing protein [soil metagenome]